ncbi:ATP-binding protein [Marinilactibacillus psychrotolerans]|uniref:ATP-binding protein n=1 Tax=Marinilactibacillus psychrotolerans TaxID=191770 RepID=UPI0038292F2C
MLKEEIMALIEEKREGTYWDFKQEYHKNKARLLHDIICLVNNINNRDAYLIFGVSDEVKILGIESDENRKNQEHFVSFLRGKKFSGGITPYVILKTVVIQQHEIDVLIIKKSDMVPFYLAEHFREGKTTVLAGSIYLRIEDQNTPIDSTADPLHTEQLWKYRLGLLPIPLQRLKKMLSKKDKWEENESGNHFEESPEFTIFENKEISESYDRKSAPFYAYNQMNSSILYHHYECKYYNTILYDTQTISLDSGRYHTPIPEFGFIEFGEYGRDNLDYRYFIKDSIHFLLLERLH